MTSTVAPSRRVHRKSLGRRMADHWQLYALLLIPVAITIVYKYGPMYGIQIAFRNYNPGLGITGSPWVGWKWFERFFRAPNFDRMLWNTIKLSLYGLLWGFPVLRKVGKTIRPFRYDLNQPPFFFLPEAQDQNQVILFPAG